MVSKTNLFVCYVLNGRVLTWLFKSEFRIYNVEIAVRNHLTKDLWIPWLYVACFERRTRYHEESGDSSEAVEETYYACVDSNLCWTKDGYPKLRKIR